jgi:hypothetical protein
LAAAQPESPQRSLRHALTMVILCVSGGTIFNVVYVFEVYYLPLQQAMELSKSQIGMLLGVFTWLGSTRMALAAVIAS